MYTYCMCVYMSQGRNIRVQAFGLRKFWSVRPFSRKRIAVTYPNEGEVPIGFSLGYPRRDGLTGVSSGISAISKTHYFGAA